MKLNLFTTLLVFLLPYFSQAQSIVGVWTTIDDDGVTKTSDLKIWKENSEYRGKIVHIYKPEDRNGKCTECDEDDSRHNQDVLGMVILENLVQEEDNLWDDGDILDPNNGEIYSCKIWLEGQDKLVIRGYLGFSFVGRNQTWIRKE